MSRIASKSFANVRLNSTFTASSKKLLYFFTRYLLVIGLFHRSDQTNVFNGIHHRGLNEPFLFLEGFAHSLFDKLLQSFFLDRRFH